MQVQSISSYNYRNNYKNLNQGEKEPPKPCFQGDTVKVLKRVGLPLAFLMGLAACHKCPMPDDSHFNPHNDTIHDGNIEINVNNTINANANATVTINFTFLTPNGDTIVPVPGGDTILPPGPGNQHYADFFDTIYGPQVQGDSTNYGWNQHFPITGGTTHIGNDTVGYASEYVEKLSHHNSIEHFKLDKTKTEPNKQFWDVDLKMPVWNNSTQQFDQKVYYYSAERYSGTVNGKPAVIQQNTVKGEDPGEIIIPSYVCYVPDNVSGKTHIYKYDSDHKLVGEAFNEVLKGNDGKVLFNHQWKDGDATQFSQEYISVRVLEAIKPEDLGGSK